MEKCTQRGEKFSASETIGDTDDEEVASCMDEATRKRAVKKVTLPLNYVI